MFEVKWKKVALYVDERANQDQQNALTQNLLRAGRPASGNGDNSESEEQRS
jgi:hypothetical protein